MQQFRVSTDVV